MDYTIKEYTQLIKALQNGGYHFLTFSEHLMSSADKQHERRVILRHDVDECPNNALKMATAEYKLGIKSTYYFRVVKKSNKPEIIKKIVEMGHEIGYHYEDLSTANGDYEKAIDSFKKNLSYFRSFYPVKTVCMHGSSTSKFDNRSLWEHHKMENFGLIGEPYLSLDFSKVFYLTDTGFSWDGGRFATRDIVKNSFDLSFHSTSQIINCIKEGAFPKQSMILSHTLWTDNLLEWYYIHSREFVRNRVKLLAMKNKFIGAFYKQLVSLYWKI